MNFLKDQCKPLETPPRWTGRKTEMSLSAAHGVIYCKYAVRALHIWLNAQSKIRLTLILGSDRAS